MFIYLYLYYLFMGAYSESYRFDKSVQTITQLKKMIKRLPDPLNTKAFDIVDKKFYSFGEAQEYYRNLDKWEKGVIFRQYLPSTSKKEKINEFIKKYKRTEKEIEKIKDSADTKSFSTKQKMKRCRNCDSYINLSYVEYRHCPICRYKGLFMSKTQFEDYNKKTKELDSISNTIKKLKVASAKVSSEFIWVAFAWISE